MLLGGFPSSGAKNGCPACAGEKGMVQFNWKWAKESPNGDLGRSVPFLIQNKKWRSGSLFQCSSCGRPWYLDEAQETMTLLSQNLARLMEAWSSGEVLLSKDLFQKALTIGATPPHLHARQKRYAEVPCRVQIRQGEWVDKCLLVFSSDPPLEDYYENARLVSDIADIEPSPFALSPSLRLAASRSEPDEKGQALTRVETLEGKHLGLNWIVNFVDRKGTQGQGLRLTGSPPKSSNKKKSGKSAVLSEPIDSITFFIGDWSEKIQDLLIK